MIEPGSLSAGQRIATLRQFFRSRHADKPAADARARVGGEWEPTCWPETEWSDTQFDASTAENC
jgi:hypothetical protein